MTLHNGEINLIDGCAVSMGEGVFVVMQDSEQGPQNVVLSPVDLRAMLAAAEGR